MKGEAIDYGEEYDSAESWAASRPACVQALIREFPVGSTFTSREGVVWCIGYTESNELIVTVVNPYLDWESALKARVYLPVPFVRACIIGESANACAH